MVEPWGWSEGAAYLRLFYRSREHQQDQMAAVAAHLPPGPQRLLDVGCGYGDFIEWLPDGYTYEGIEAKEEVFLGAQAQYPDHTFRCSSEVTDADVIVCIAAMQNEVVKPRHLIKQMLDHSKLLIMTTAKKHYDEETVRKLFRRKIRIVNGDPDDDFFTVIAKGRL